MLNGSALQRTANFAQRGFAFRAFDAIQFDLDQAMCGERTIYFLDDRIRRTILADTDNRAQMVGFSAFGA